jgi:hypothetical protein
MSDNEPKCDAGFPKGYEEDWTPDVPMNAFKIPRGIISYTFIGSPNTTVSNWKVTGNLGGENVSSCTRAYVFLAYLTALMLSVCRLLSGPAK